MVRQSSAPISSADADRSGGTAGITGSEARASDAADVVLTPEQAAEVLGVSTRTLSNWRSAGIGPKWFRLADRLIRYRRSELHAWLREQERRSEQTMSARRERRGSRSVAA